MTTRRTVLILGAGASAPYGFPVGSRLRELILNRIGYKHYGIREHVDRLHDSGDIDTFLDSFKRSLISIDAFLEHRRDHMDIGKACIAAVLLPFENPEYLYTQSSNDSDVKFLGSPWYAHLVGRLTAATDPEDFHNHALSVITFNYDRSFEYAILESLVHTYDLAENDARKLLETITILYIHGKLGDLPETVHSTSVNSYSGSVHQRKIRVAADSIRIIHEDQEDKQILEDAQSLIRQAATICFLGFGYHPENMRKLGFEGDYEWPKTMVYGTTYGKTAQEVEEAWQLLGGKPRVTLPRHPSTPIDARKREYDCLDALRNYPIL